MKISWKMNKQQCINVILLKIKTADVMSTRICLLVINMSCIIAQLNLSVLHLHTAFKKLEFEIWFGNIAVILNVSRRLCLQDFLCPLPTTAYALYIYRSQIIYFVMSLKITLNGMIYPWIKSRSMLNSLQFLQLLK